VKNITPANSMAVYEYCLKRFDGNKRWIQWCDKAVFDENGNIFEIQSIGRDITEEKKAAHFVAVQRDLGISLGAISDLNEALELCLDTALEVSNLDFGGIFLLSEDEYEFKLQVWKGSEDYCLDEKTSFRFDSEKAYRIRKGYPIYNSIIDFSGISGESECQESVKCMAFIPIKTHNRVIGSFNVGTCVCAEIPENSRNALEAVAAQIGNTIDRIKAEESVWENRQNLDLLFNSITDMIFIVDMDLKVVKVNNEVIIRLGYSEEEIIGTSICNFHCDKFRDMAKEASKAIIEGKSGYCVVPLLTRDGSQIPVETKITYGKWREKDVIIGISRDISERIKMQNDLQIKDKELNDFTYTVSHDLRNPVTILKSFLVAIKEDPELFDGYFERVLKQSDRLKHFVDDMIALSRAGKIINEKMPVNLVCLLKRVFVEMKYPSNQVELIIKPDFVKMESDPSRMEKVFVNLFTNSFQFYDSKKKKLLIEITFSKNDNHVEIRFKDNGIGVEQENLEKIFEVGFTYNKNLRNGFGLPVCRKIVEAHGGKMWAELNSSDNGNSGGITFVMRFSKRMFSFENINKVITT
jgi:PAS domain S-box-containing protein